MARDSKKTISVEEQDESPFPLREWDPAEDFRDEEEMALYLAACLESGDMNVFLAALGDVIRAKEMAKTSKKTNVAASLYEAVASDSRPCFATIVKIAHSLGVGIDFYPLASRKRRAAPTRARPVAEAVAH